MSLYMHVCFCVSFKRICHRNNSTTLPFYEIEHKILIRQSLIRIQIVHNKSNGKSMKKEFLLHTKIKQVYGDYNCFSFVQ